jgi:hypothetical protein
MSRRNSKPRKVYLGTAWSSDGEIDVNELVFTKMNMFMGNQAGSNWTGTMSKLLTVLNKISSKNQRETLPGSPGALRIVINRIANRLRNRGIGVRFARTTDHARTRYVKFTH